MIITITYLWNIIILIKIKLIWPTNNVWTLKFNKKKIIKTKIADNLTGTLVNNIARLHMPNI